MQPLRSPQLRPVPDTLKMQPRFWSSFTFIMCKWAFFEARKQDGPAPTIVVEARADSVATFLIPPGALRIRERQSVIFIGPHPRVREHARRMFDPSAHTGSRERAYRMSGLKLHHG